MSHHSTKEAPAVSLLTAAFSWELAAVSTPKALYGEDHVDKAHLGFTGPYSKHKGLVMCQDPNYLTLDTPPVHT